MAWEKGYSGGWSIIGRDEKKSVPDPGKAWSII